MAQLSPLKCFYVYFYLRQDGTPYYVGKGKTDRAYQKHEIKIPGDRSRIVFVGINMTEKDAFTLEQDQILFYGRKDLGTGILRNKTSGGEGCSGHRHSEETKQRLRELNFGEKNRMFGRRGPAAPNYGKPMAEEIKEKIRKANTGKTKSKEHRRKLSESKKGKSWGSHTEAAKQKISQGHKGKKLSEKQKAKLRKPVYLIHPNGQEEWFSSILEAAAKYDLNKGHIASICRGERKSHKEFKARFDLTTD